MKFLNFVFLEFLDDNVDVTVFVLLMLSLFGNSCCTIWIRRRIVQLRAKVQFCEIEIETKKV